MARRGDGNKNGRLALIFGGVALGMVGLAFAAVPAYRVFCQVTGYGGTPRVAVADDRTEILDREVAVRFDASTDGHMPWRFRPIQREVHVRLGEQILIHYQATNPTDETITGTATFNITPLKAAQYFTKIDCFCFTEQTLKPGQTADMPVVFYVDPAMAEDETVSDVHTLTLSYTFFRKDDQVADGGQGS